MHHYKSTNIFLLLIDRYCRINKLRTTRRMYISNILNWLVVKRRSHREWAFLVFSTMTILIIEFLSSSCRKNNDHARLLATFSWFMKYAYHVQQTTSTGLSTTQTIVIHLIDNSSTTGMTYFPNVKWFYTGWI